MKTRNRQTKSGPTARPQPASRATKPPSPQSLLGQRLPDYELKDASGNDVRLRDFYKTGRMVLYFYPRDMTPGCTREACAFRDGLEELKKLNAVVVGVSADDPASHARFSAKYNLNFPLLTDSGARLSRALGIFKKKKLYGREFEGIERTTLIVDQQGTIRHVFPKVKVSGHLAEVLEALKRDQEQ